LSKSHSTTAEFIRALFRLQVEAEAANQAFLAYLVGLAIIEANQVLNEASRDSGSRIDGHGP
jgi:hypothetical protein